jgi:hypothetical protein
MHEPGSRPWWAFFLDPVLILAHGISLAWTWNANKSIICRHFAHIETLDSCLKDSPK